MLARASAQPLEQHQSCRSKEAQVLIQLVPVSPCHLAPNGWAFSAHRAFSPPARGPAASAHQLSGAHRLSETWVET